MRRWTYMAITGLIVLAFILIVFSKMFGGGKSNSELRENDLKRMQDAVEVINSMDIDMMVFGRDMQGEGMKNLTYRRIYDFTVEALDIGNYPEFYTRMIVINDVTEELFISDEQWAEIKRLVYEDDFYLVVLGPGKFEQMKEAGIIPDLPSSSAKSTIVWKGGAASMPGFADNPELVPYYVEKDLSEEDVPAYTMIMELSTKQIFWS